MLGELNKQTIACVKREMLARAVIKAEDAVYKAQADFDRAKNSKIDTAPYRMPMAKARATGRATLLRLNGHINAHGCWLHQESGASEAVRTPRRIPPVHSTYRRVPRVLVKT
jgi:hypothetical protein